MKRVVLTPREIDYVKSTFRDLNLTELKYMCIEPAGENYQVGFSVIAGNRIVLNDGTDTVTINADKMADILFNLLD